MRNLTQKIRALAVLFSLLLLPSTALSVQLFEGNLGLDGDWLQVLDVTTMSDRIYWYDVGGDVSYHVEFSTDAEFSAIAAEFDGATMNYVVPDLGLGFYHFRVSAIDSTGAVVSSSKSGTLEVIEDTEFPKASILSPAEGQSFSQGDTVSIELEVSDDTVLRLARFTINGEYVGVLGLKAENLKLKLSMGTSRTVTFAYQIPTSGKSGPMDILVSVSDVAYKSILRTVTINVGKASGTGSTSTNNGNGKGKGKGNR